MAKAALKFPPNVPADLQRLASIYTATRMLSLLKPGSLNAATMSISALLHAQELDPDGDDAETPLATMRYVVPRLNEHSRNAVGSIACALVNMQDAVARDPGEVWRLLKIALSVLGTSPRQKKPKKKKGGR